MDHSAPISAGIEKFYTTEQFLTVLFLTLSLVLTVLLVVFIGSHSGKGPRKRLFLLFMTGFIVFQGAEVGLAMCPAKGALVFWMAADFTGLFFLSRLFFLFCRALPGVEKDRRFVTIFFGIEGVFYCIAALTGFPGIPFFQRLSTDLSVPGPLTWLFLSEALGWMASGAFVLLRESKIRGRSAFLLGTLFCTGTLYLHHFLWLDYGTLILPAGLLVTILFWRWSLLKRNYLGLFLDSFKGATDYVPLFIAVITPDGRFLSTEGNAPALFQDKTFKSVEDLIGLLKNAGIPESAGEFLGLLEEQRFDQLESGRFPLGRSEPRVFLAWSVRPVRYRRRNLAWILAFRDVTEEEEDIRKAAGQEAELLKFYERLKLYRKTGMYRDNELEREKLMKTVRATLEALTGDLESLITSNDTYQQQNNELLSRLISAARGALAEIRASVYRLKKLHREEME